MKVGKKYKQVTAPARKSQKVQRKKPAEAPDWKKIPMPIPQPAPLPPPPSGV